MIWNNAGIVLISLLGTNFRQNLNRILNMFFHESAFENVVRKMAAILSQPQCVYVRWLLDVSLDWDIIGSSNGLSPARYPATSQYPGSLVRIYVFENAVCKLSAILSKPQCVKHDDCMHQYRFTFPVNKHSRLQTPITEHCRWKESSYIMDRI